MGCVWWWIWIFLEHGFIISRNMSMLETIMFECVMLFIFVFSPVVQLIPHNKFMAVLGWEARGEFRRTTHFWLTGEKWVL
jgi:hypothetical protein